METNLQAQQCFENIDDSLLNPELLGDVPAFSMIMHDLIWVMQPAPRHTRVIVKHGISPPTQGSTHISPPVHCTLNTGNDIISWKGLIQAPLQQFFDTKALIKPMPPLFRLLRFFPDVGQADPFLGAGGCYHAAKHAVKLFWTRARLRASRGLPCCHSTCVSEN